MQETGDSVARYLRVERWEDVPTDVMLEKTMRYVVLGCHANRGVIKASLKHASNRPEEWLPHRESGEAVVERMVALLVPRMTVPPEQAEMRVRFAMQAVFSIVVNAILNDAGPLRQQFAARVQQRLLGLARTALARGLQDRGSRYGGECGGPLGWLGGRRCRRREGHGNSVCEF